MSTTASNTAVNAVDFTTDQGPYSILAGLYALLANGASTSTWPSGQTLTVDLISADGIAIPVASITSTSYQTLDLPAGEVEFNVSTSTGAITASLVRIGQDN